MTEEKSSMLINCKKCNRLFSSKDGSTLCSRCSDVIDDGFGRVREYIYENPTSSLKDVSHGTGVEADAILKWIREGKIILSDRSNISFCERCGVAIDGGRYCGKCIKELSEGLKVGIGQNDVLRGAGIHIREIESTKNKK